MAKQYIIRQKIAEGYEPVKNEIIEDLPPIALAILLYRLSRNPKDRQPTTDDLVEWYAGHAKGLRIGRDLVRRNDAVLVEKGFKHFVKHRPGKGTPWTTDVIVYRLPVMPCAAAESAGEDTYCESCKTRLKDTPRPTEVCTPETRPTEVRTPADELDPQQDGRSGEVPGLQVSGGSAACGLKTYQDDYLYQDEEQQDEKDLTSAAEPRVRPGGDSSLGDQDPAAPSTAGESQNRHLRQEDPSPDRTGWIVAAFVALDAGLIIDSSDHRAVRWLWDTFSVDGNGYTRNPAVFARHLVKCWRAAPDELKRLAAMAADGELGVPGSAWDLSDLLSTVNTAPRSDLTRDEADWYGRVAAVAANRAWPGMTARQSIEVAQALRVPPKPEEPPWGTADDPWAITEGAAQ